MSSKAALTPETIASGRVPLRLSVGLEESGIQGGSWLWKGQKLYYEYAGVGGNNGVFYDCGNDGVYMYLKRYAIPSLENILINC